MIESSYTIQPIGIVRSELASLEAAPRQGDEGAPEAWLDLTAQVAQGLAGVLPGDELIVLTWFHRARRDVLQVHPRGRIDAPLTGAFATRAKAEGCAPGGCRRDAHRGHQARARARGGAMTQGVTGRTSVT